MRCWVVWSGSEAFVAFVAVAGEEFVEPAAGDAVGVSDFADAAAFDEHGVDDVASQVHAHGPPWSCPGCLATCVRDLLKPDTPSPTVNVQVRGGFPNPLRPDFYRTSTVAAATTARETSAALGRTATAEAFDSVLGQLGRTPTSASCGVSSRV